MTFTPKGFRLTSKAEVNKLLSIPTPLNSILEVGVASGVTSSTIAYRKPKLNVYCVDPYRAIKTPEVLSKDPERVYNVLENRRDNQRIWVGGLKGFLDITTIRFDFVFLDGGHTEHNVMTQLDMLKGRTNLIVAHDYVTKKWHGVKKAVDMFCLRENWEITEIHYSMAFVRG